MAVEASRLWNSRRIGVLELEPSTVGVRGKETFKPEVFIGGSVIELDSNELSGGGYSTEEYAVRVQVPVSPFVLRIARNWRLRISGDEYKVKRIARLSQFELIIEAYRDIG